jgi:hypothetical protein
MSMKDSDCATDGVVARWPRRSLLATGAALIALSVGGLVIPSAPPLLGQDGDTEKPDAVAVFMRAKLGHSQHVLEGLALADFDLIARGAQELSLASQASSWQVLQTADYARQSGEFRRSCDRLHRAAKEKNLDGAALAWMEVMMQCVQCHKYVRDEQDAPAR